MVITMALLSLAFSLIALAIRVWPHFVEGVTTDVSHPEDRRFWRFVIRDRDSDAPYLTRWSWKLPFSNWIARLHIIERPDSTPCCHDHPWEFWTLCVWGGYTEIIEEPVVLPDGVMQKRWLHRVRPLTLHHRDSHFRHTIMELHASRSVTLVLTGPKDYSKSWGFWTKWGFKPYWEFLRHGKPVRALWCRD